MKSKKLPAVKSGLNVTDLGSELIVFDSATSNAHCLDKVGGAVFVSCKDNEGLDGLEKRRGSDFSEGSVQAALQQLTELGLLEEEQGGVDRRRFLSAVGSGVAGVVVASVAAPSPVAATSCNRCRLSASGAPCNCADCAQPCSYQGGLENPCGSGPVKGACGFQSVCCFEFIKSTADNSVSCATEGFGTYGCRDVLGDPRYNPDCATARAGVNIGQRYYCCTCTGAPAQYTC